MRVTLAAGDDPVAAVRAATAESVVLVFASDRDPVMMARDIAAIGPLAIESAPVRRVNAVIAGPGSAADAVDAAVVFLDQALSTTGQVITVA
ncbi:hypothetical protein ASE75_13165 [Sphingomonas sp. Leaf17]|uniref:Rossmann fold domain-containing protein n=1 Tax=Sphingomonas sp. Leaf17 TaxID=1735683 RepID=UPI0006F7D0ED|nr:hypothetical protein [Sphingomonas sp. Leaf17]KQM63393.1 hypothetical protein ASE75_13165 [Sphingomonas sp. Leaf17]